MKKLIVSLPRIFCRKQQGITGINKDEVYVIVINFNSEVFSFGSLCHVL